MTTSILNLLQVLLLPLGWGGCYCLARELAARKHIDPDWRLSWALASALWGAILTLIIELASSMQSLTGPLLWAEWLLVDLGLFVVVLSLARRRGAVISEEVRRWWQGVRAMDFSEWPLDARCYLGTTILFAGFLFTVALAFATTNWDSLTYHLPRIMHWIQEQSVNHFPTNNTRQVEFAPWSSFTALTLYLLWDGDRLVNLVQWCSMSGSIILLSFVVKALAFEKSSYSAAQRNRISALTCLIAVTLPMGLVQSMNPQTDYTAAFWLCCLVCFVLALCREPGNSWYMLGAGLACGLGTLTKATTYVYAAPLAAGFAIWWISRSVALRVKIRSVVICCSAFLLLNAGHMMRNDAVFGSPLGSKSIVSLEKNSRISASGTAANVVRNLSLHNNSAIPPLTASLNYITATAHKWTGRDYEDPETTYTGSFSLSEKFEVFDSTVGGPYHLWLIFAALFLALLQPKHYRTALWHTAWIITSFLFFCAYLKWQVNHSRLHLPYFLLLAPVVAWVLVESAPRWCVVIVSTVMVLFGGYCLANNQSRPLNSAFAALPRESQYLAVHKPRMNEPIRLLAEAIIASRCENVGLKLRFDQAEYPIWVMLRNRGFKGTIHHVYIDNNTWRLPTRHRTPCVIVAAQGTPPKSVVALYPEIRRFGELDLMSNRDGSHSEARIAESFEAE